VAEAIAQVRASASAAGSVPAPNLDETLGALRAVRGPAEG